MAVGKKEFRENKIGVVDVGQLPVLLVGRKQSRETKIQLMQVGQLPVMVGGRSSRVKLKFS